MQIERFQKYEATLKIRRDDSRFGHVRPEIEILNGKRIQTTALWRIDCGEDEFANKGYDGEWAMETPCDWPVQWVASGDLENITPLKEKAAGSEPAA